MNINAMQSFGPVLDDEEENEKYAQAISFCESGSYELDITGCVIDYYAMSKLIDAFLTHLERFDGAKKIDIIYDLDFSDYSLLKWLFLGSSCLGLNNIRLSDEEIARTIDEGLKKRGVRFTCKIVDSHAGETRRFSNGS